MYDPVRSVPWYAQPAPPRPLAPPPAPLAAPPPQAPMWPPRAAAFPAPRAQGFNWDPLAELAFSVVGTPLAALAGAGIGFLSAGPIGAARGAMLGAALPGTVFAGHEAYNTARGNRNGHSGWPFVAVLMGFPALSAAGYGIGLAVAGAAGAAWGTLIAAAAPVTVVVVGGWIHRKLYPPRYDPAPYPAPTDPPPRI